MGPKGEGKGDENEDKDGNRKEGKGGEKEGDRKGPKGPKESEEKNDVMPTGVPVDRAGKDEGMKGLKRALLAFLKRADEKVGKNEGEDRKEAKEGDGKEEKGDRKE